jgi:hypothetical protein
VSPLGDDRQDRNLPFNGAPDLVSDPIFRVVYPPAYSCRTDPFGTDYADKRRRSLKLAVEFLSRLARAGLADLAVNRSSGPPNLRRDAGTSVENQNCVAPLPAKAAHLVWATRSEEGSGSDADPSTW